MAFQLNVDPGDPGGQPVPNAIITCVVLSVGAKPPLSPCPFEPKIKQQPNFFSDDTTEFVTAMTAQGFAGPYFVYGTVVAPGFNPAYFPVAGGFGVPWDGHGTLNIPVPMTRSFKKPSRTEIAAVRANFCNLRDADDIPMFDIYLLSLLRDNLSKAEDWITRLRAAGTKHIQIGMSCNYNEPLGWAPIYPIPGIDTLVGVPEYQRAIEWIISRGFIPRMMLGLDGQAGWAWGMANLPTLLPQLKQYVEWGMFSTGFDGCFPDWSRDQTIQMLQLIQQLLGEEACIETEFWSPGTVGYCHMGEGPGDWTPTTLGILANFNVELLTFPPDPTGVQQTASRLLGPAARNIDPGNEGPYFLAGLPPNAVNICMDETCAYQAIRKQATPTEADAIAREMATYGFSSFGNGQP